MTNPDTEIVFVWAAYIAAMLVVAAIIGWTLYDAHAQRKALARLEAQGVRRRSDAAKT